MPLLKYLYPETPLDENSRPESPLTSVSNKDGARDVYDNPSFANGETKAAGTGLVQDKLALGSQTEPSTYENPIAGGFYQTGPSYCDTCGMEINAFEIAEPAHLGHNVRYGDGQVNEDIDLKHKTGGDYRIEAMYSAEPSNPSGMDGQTEGVTTKPLLKSQPGDPETKNGYSWCPKPIEENKSYENLVFDEAVRNLPDSERLIDDDMEILDSEDRTVPM